MARQNITTNKELAAWLDSKPVLVTGLNPGGIPVRGKMIPTVKFDESGNLVKVRKYRQAA